MTKEKGKTIVENISKDLWGRDEPLSKKEVEAFKSFLKGTNENDKFIINLDNIYIIDDKMKFPLRKWIEIVIQAAINKR